MASSLPRSPAMNGHRSPGIGTFQRVPRNATEPPSTPRKEDDSESQYASYPTTPNRPQLLQPMTVKTGKKDPWSSIDEFEKERRKRGPIARFLFQDEGWTPLPLKPIFWIPYAALLLAFAVGLEVALYVSNKNNGWPIEGDVTDSTDWVHYAVILPPAFTATGIVAIWAWTDSEIKKMQPFVDLIHGDSEAKRSLLLDYTRTNNFLSWIQALGNKHYLVAGATILALVTLIFQPIASALVTVRVVWEDGGAHTVHNQEAIGLNQNSDFDDLTSFLTAAGYASASVLYDLGDIPFVLNDYTVASFEPPSLNANGSVTAKTAAVKSTPGCQPASVQMNSDGNGNWTNFAQLNGCSLTFQVSRITDNLFGSNPVICEADRPEASVPDQFKPIMFWFFTYEPRAAASATICYPSIELVEVEATVDLRNSNLTKVKEIGPFTPGVSNLSDYSWNVTGPPLNGMAYNGIAFNLTDPDIFVLARANATQLQLPASAFQLAKQDSAGFTASFETGKFVQWTNQVYATYLKLIAKTIYFLPVDAALTVEARTLQNRAFLSAPAVHILAVAFFLVALGSTIIQVLHYFDRRDLVLKHEPGTLASAIYVGADTQFAALIADRENDEQVKEAIRQARFRLDPLRNKVLMSTEAEYQATDKVGDLPGAKLSKRDTLVAAMAGHRNRHSQRWSKNPHPRSPHTPAPSSPLSPRTPASNRSSPGTPTRL